MSDQISNQCGSEPAKPGSQQRLVRPRWNDLCLCVTIHCSQSPQRPKETDAGYIQRKLDTARAAYESGADWFYKADCKCCNQGSVA